MSNKNICEIQNSKYIWIKCKIILAFYCCIQLLYYYIDIYDVKYLVLSIQYHSATLVVSYVFSYLILYFCNGQCNSNALSVLCVVLLII